MERFDVLITGAGCVGRSLALSLARQGHRIALLPGQAPAKAPPVEDLRAYALNAASVALLKALKVWDALPPDAATPVYDMHVAGDQAGAAIDFSAWQQGVRELAYIVDAGALEQELATAVRFAPHIQIVDHAVPAALHALCEGRASQSREQLGVGFDSKSYGHSAIAARLVSDAPHLGCARQWFRAPDVLALLPFNRPSPEQSYGLVWSMPDERVPELLEGSPQAFEEALNQATDGAAGRLSLASARMAWPLSLARADKITGPGWALLGDAAHVVHPLAGQGLNLGLADVAALVRVLAGRENWRGLGDERLLRRYERERLAPNWAMGQMTDGLLRLFASEQPALRELRNRGLTLVNQLTPLKRWLTARALDA
jgi:2-polyprenyl-6-methoxyphenol hydroxylase-like FAD-dependent oxidoreductase